MTSLVCRAPCPSSHSPPAAVNRRQWSPTNPCSRSSRWQLGRARRRLAVAAAAANGTSSASEAPGGSAVVLFPGFLFPSNQYAGLADELRRRGHPTEVVPTSVADWLPSLRGGSFEWYLERADKVVQGMHSRHGRLALVGHSAGGWIARLLLGGEPYQGVRYGRSPLVHTLLTLGTPHQSIEDYPFGRKEEALVGPRLAQAPPEVAGSSLKFANYFYPSAESLGGPRVVCACGDAVRGRALWRFGGGGGGGSGEDNLGSYRATDSTYASYASVGSMDEAALSSGGGSGGGGSDGGGSSNGGNRYDAFLAFNAYKAVCGRGDVDGDSVTPLCISHLPGAEALVLPGVWHIARRKADQPWYGDGDVVDQWQQYLVEPAAQAQREPAARGAA